MRSRTVSTKIPSELQERVDEIAAIERRTPSNVVRLAIESFVKSYFELHPQFKADILEAKKQMEAGDIKDYEFGQSL